jgi:hypothetical protein
MSIYLLLPDKELQNKIMHYTSTTNLHASRRVDASSSNKNVTKALRKSSGGDVEMRELKRSTKIENADAGGEKMAGKGKRKDESSGSDTRERLNISGAAGACGDSDSEETRKKAKREGGMKPSAIAAPATLANSYMLTTTMTMGANERSFISPGRRDDLNVSQCSSASGSLRGKPKSLKDEMNRFVKSQHHQQHNSSSDKRSRRESYMVHQQRMDESGYGTCAVASNSLEVSVVEEDKSKAKVRTLSQCE